MHRPGLPSILAVIALAAVLPAVWRSGADVQAEILIWATYALGYNLLLGCTGLPSFGHGAFVGLGGYACGLAQQKLGAGLIGSLAAAVAAAALLAGLCAVLLAGRRGIYYSLLTIAIGQVCWFTAQHWHGLTGGEGGLQGLVRPPLDLGVAGIALADNRAFAWLCAGIFVVVLLGLWRLIASPFGMALQAVKQNELRAQFIGYPVALLKSASLVISAAIAGLAGGLLALKDHSAYPNVMDLHQSGQVVMMVLVGGGLVHFLGPVIGAVVYFGARDLLGGATEHWLLWYGLLFMAVVLFKPEGIGGLLRPTQTPPPEPLPGSPTPLPEAGRS